MYKLMIGITAAAMTAGLGMTTVLAQNSTQTSESKTAVVNYVDDNNDGICDNAGYGQRAGQGQNFVDEDGDGVCDNAGTRHCAGRSFTDANGDGICDNAGSRQGNHCGQGRRAGQNQ